MKHWKKEWLTKMSGVHIYSEEYFRIQVLDAPSEKTELWRIPRGELLIIVLEGDILVETEDEIVDATILDQVVLAEGEKFSIRNSDSNRSIIQMIWSPGISTKKKVAK